MAVDWANWAGLTIIDTTRRTKWRVWKNKHGLWQADCGTMLCCWRDWRDARDYAYGWALWEAKRKLQRSVA
jgi:hypothetical protein